MYKFESTTPRQLGKYKAPKMAKNAINGNEDLLIDLIDIVYYDKSAFTKAEKLQRIKQRIYED
jgi:hypothetical protein